MKKFVITLLVFLILSGSGWAFWHFFLDKPPVSEVIYIPVNQDVQETQESQDENSEDGVETQYFASPELETEQNQDNQDENQATQVDNQANQVPVTIPGAMTLDVLFSTQAPTQNWDMPYQEACEEASLIMTYYYFAEKYLDRSIMNEEILALVDWEVERLGYYKDTTLAETQIVADEYFHLDTEISTDVSEENIKYQLNQGNLLVVPFAGRMLDNPYFSGEGPLFHMLVVKGYDHKDFITNDPGLLTKGENFRYSYKNLLESVHDWNGGDVNNGRRVMLIVKGIKLD